MLKYWNQKAFCCSFFFLSECFWDCGVRTIGDPVFDAVNELQVFENQGKISTTKLQQIRLKALPSPHLDFYVFSIRGMT